MVAIARHAGVAIQTVYDQFGSKGGLLMAVIDDVQRSSGLFAELRGVFSSPDGEAAMRRMIAATFRLWHGAWPYLAFILRARRIDAVVATEMDVVDRLRLAHFWAITRRLADEGRLLPGLSAEAAANRTFALSAPTIYEELVVRLGTTPEEAAATATTASLAAILEPGAVNTASAPPDWVKLEQDAAARAIAGGADPRRLTPDWVSAPGTPQTTIPG